MGLQSATLACASALPAGLPSTPVLLLRERHASCNSRHTAARVPALTIRLYVLFPSGGLIFPGVSFPWRASSFPESFPRKEKVSHARHHTRLASYSTPYTCRGHVPRHDTDNASHHRGHLRPCRCSRRAPVASRAAADPAFIHGNLARASLYPSLPRQNT